MTLTSVSRVCAGTPTCHRAFVSLDSKSLTEDSQTHRNIWKPLSSFRKCFHINRCALFLVSIITQDIGKLGKLGCKEDKKVAKSHKSKQQETDPGLQTPYQELITSHPALLCFGNGLRGSALHSRLGISLQCCITLTSWTVCFLYLAAQHPIF